MDTRDIELMKVDMQFGTLVDAENNDKLPVVMLTVIAVGQDVRTLQDNPVEMLGILMDQIAARHSEGLINPVTAFDRREQADGTPE